MEAVGQQLTEINAAIGELRAEMKELKENVDKKFIQIESQIDLVERNNATTTDEISKEIHSLLELTKNMEHKVEELDRESKTASKENKDKIQSIESLSTEMFERVFHNESSLQLKMEQMSSTVEEMKTKMASMALERTTPDVKNLAASNQLEIYKWTITDVRNKVQLDKWECQSETFIFFGYKNSIHANLKKDDDRLTISLQFQSGNTINKFMDKHEFTKVKYIVKDQINGDDGRDIIYENQLKFVECFVQHNWIFIQNVPVEILSPPYVKNNCIKIAMRFEPPSIDRSFVSNNGVLKWTVDNFKIKKQGQWHKPIWSPSFYTSPRGYRVQVILSINYNPIIAQVNFCTGEHDAFLSCTFPHKTTITLFNQIDPSKNLVKSEQRTDVSIYSIQLESHEFLLQNGFISNESIRLQVAIEQLANKSRP